jgi:hypothetical protein
MAGGHHGRWRLETAGQKREGMVQGINCHKARLKGGKEGEGRRPGARLGEAEEGKEREEGEGAPTGGVPVSVTAGKKKRGKGTRAAAGGR